MSEICNFTDEKILQSSKKELEIVFKNLDLDLPKRLSVGLGLVH